MSWFDLDVSSPRVLNIEELRLRARRRLPRAVYDYLEGGAEGESTVRKNCLAFDELEFLPRFGVANETFDARTTVLGCDLAHPLLLAPCGMLQLFHPDAEIAAARAASDAGIGQVLSSGSSKSLEDVASASSAPLWYQLYMWGGRAAAEAGIERAKAVGYRVLVVTVDTNKQGKRERDIRNNLVGLWGYEITTAIKFMPQLLGHLKWALPFLISRPPADLPNVRPPGQDSLQMADIRAGIGKPETSATWQDLGWISQLWKGPIVVKGILTEEDAVLARDLGASGVVVSNHGGRQLDGVPATIQVLPQIVDAVGDVMEVLLDSGIRRGSDVARAICLGARAVLIGRSYVYGLAAAGQTGVARAIQILCEDFATVSELLGCKSTSELRRALIR